MISKLVNFSETLHKLIKSVDAIVHGYYHEVCAFFSTMDGLIYLLRNGQITKDEFCEHSIEVYERFKKTNNHRTNEPKSVDRKK